MKVVYKSLFSLLAFGLILCMISCGGGQNVSTTKAPAYKVGGTGPGGGIVFFAEDGQYKECSEELGILNWHDASRIAKRHKGGDLADWRLPDKDELDLMYQNLHKEGLNDFAKAWYWSSSQDGNDAWHQNFNNGNQRIFSKFEANRVRAVRAF